MAGQRRNWKQHAISLGNFFFLPRLSNSNLSHVTFTKPSYKDPGWEILKVGCHKVEQKYKIPAYKA